MELYYFSPELLFYWLVAFSVYEWISIYIILLFSNKRFNAPVEYYSKFPSIIPVLSDFTYSTAILISGHILFKILENYKLINDYNKITKLFIFFLIIIAIQSTYDLIFAYFIYKMPIGYSKYIDLFKKYIKEASFGAVFVDTLWLILFLLTTQLFITYLPLPFATFILSMSIFLWIIIKY